MTQKKRIHTSASLLCALLFLLSGCTVGPDYKRPPVATPPAFKENQGWKTAEPGDALLKGAWWKLYDDPRLNELEAQVLVSNQNIAAAEAQFREAAAIVQATRAGLFPVVGASTGISRAGKPATSGSTSKTGVTANDYLVSANISWEIDLWGKTRRAVESSQASAQAGAADLAAMRLSMQALLAQDYFQLRALDAQAKLLDETVVEYRKYLDMTRNRYNSGIASKADVLKAETQLETTRAQALDTRVQRAQTEHAIAVLTGQPASSFSLPFSPLVGPPPSIPVGIPSAILERRPDIAAAERRMAAASAGIGMAEAAYFPTITLDASGGFEAARFAKWLVSPSRFWSVGASAAETLFDAGYRGAQTEKAIAAFDAGVASYRQTVLTGFQEVEDNLAALRILEDEAKVQERAVLAARRSAEISMNQYKAGITSYLDVVTALATSLADQRTALDIDARRMTASVQLIKALGGGWNAADMSTESGGSPVPSSSPSVDAGKIGGGGK